jgi:hypothetical protein
VDVDARRDVAVRRRWREDADGSATAFFPRGAPRV